MLLETIKARKMNFAYHMPFTEGINITKGRRTLDAKGFTTVKGLAILYQKSTKSVQKLSHTQTIRRVD